MLDVFLKHNKIHYKVMSKNNFTKQIANLQNDLLKEENKMDVQSCWTPIDEFDCRLVCEYKMPKYLFVL